MSRENIFIPFLLISLFFELTIIPFPFVFLFSLILYALYPTERTVILTMLIAVLADILNVAVIGGTSLALLIGYLFLDYYKKAFDTRDWRILLLILLLSTFIYSNIFSYETNLLIYLFLFTGAWIVIHYFIRDKKLWLK